MMLGSVRGLVIALVMALVSAPGVVAQEKAKEASELPRLRVMPAAETPTPAGVKQAMDGLRSVSVGEIQNMSDSDLAALQDLCRSWVQLIAFEEKRRKERR